MQKLPLPCHWVENGTGADWEGAWEQIEAILEQLEAN
jgi:hypothetical protein